MVHGLQSNVTPPYSTEQTETIVVTTGFIPKSTLPVHLCRLYTVGSTEQWARLIPVGKLTPALRSGAPKSYAVWAPAQWAEVNFSRVSNLHPFDTLVTGLVPLPYTWTLQSLGMIWFEFKNTSIPLESKTKLFQSHPSSDEANACLTRAYLGWRASRAARPLWQMQGNLLIFLSLYLFSDAGGFYRQILLLELSQDDHWLVLDLRIIF